MGLSTVAPDSVVSHEHGDSVRPEKVLGMLKDPLSVSLRVSGGEVKLNFDLCKVLVIDALPVPLHISVKSLNEAARGTSSAELLQTACRYPPPDMTMAAMGGCAGQGARPGQCGGARLRRMQDGDGGPQALRPVFEGFLLLPQLPALTGRHTRPPARRRRRQQQQQLRRLRHRPLRRASWAERAQGWRQRLSMQFVGCL